VHDVDNSDGERIVSTSGHNDEYQLEEIEVTECDFMRPHYETIGLVEFKNQWDAMGEQQETVKKYSLGLDSTQAAVTAVIDILGITSCENSHIVAEGARTHALKAYGVFFPNVMVLARAAFIADAKLGVTLKIGVRSENQQVNAMLTNAIR